MKNSYNFDAEKKKVWQKNLVNSTMILFDFWQSDTVAETDIW